MSIFENYSRSEVHNTELKENLPSFVFILIYDVSTQEK